MANFNTYKSTLLQIEGTYQNNPSDSGNFNSMGVLVGTNYGISARFYEAVINRPPTQNDIKNITVNEALNLHKKYFWDAIKADSIIDQAIAEILTDHAINAGVSAAVKLVQTVLNKNFKKTLAVDGVMGSNTLLSINTANNNLLFSYISQARKDFYNSLNNSVFSSGWLDRIKQIAEKFNKTLNLSQDNTMLIAASIIGVLWVYMLTKLKDN